MRWKAVGHPTVRKQRDKWVVRVAEHRWAVAYQLGVLYGLRCSEVLALRWDDFDPKGRTLRIDESLVAVNRDAFATASPVPAA